MNPSLFSFFNRGVASIFALSFGIAAAPNGFVLMSSEETKLSRALIKQKKY